MILLGAVTILAAGCAQDVGDINRVQANALKKSDFEGVWYFRQTVTDVPAHIDYTFIGYSSSLEKIRWEVRENFLIAYRSYELTPGRDPEAGGRAAGRTYVSANAEGDGFDIEAYKEEPVAAFRIQSHFDIQRAYNPNTGEQSNVIVENYSDRIWNERKYFRVDWSTNYVSELFFMTDMNWVASTRYFVQEDEGGPDAFYKEMRPSTDDIEGDEIAYFDFVNKLSLDPDLINCWYYNLSCTAGEIKLRLSFSRLEDIERDYEPADYTDRHMNKFGYFRTIREEYDRREGFTDKLRHNFANRHDIWHNDYKRDADGEYLRDSNDRRIPTPMAERVPKPIIYYLNPDYPEIMVPSARATGADWDRAFKRAVAAAKGEGWNVERVTEEYGDLFLICHNPVQEGDSPKCDPRPVDARTNADGEFEPFEVRLGDLRYNVFWWVDRPQAAGPLGYGPPFADPETGEIVSGTAYIYGASIDLYAQSGVDVVKMVNNDFTDEELRNGVDIAEYLEEAFAKSNVDPRTQVGEEQWKRLEETTFGQGEDFREFERKLLGDKKFDKVELIRNNRLDDVLDTNITRHQQTMQRFEQAGWDKRLLDSEQLAVLARHTDKAVGDLTEADIDTLLERNSPLKMRDQLKRSQAFRDLAARNNIYLAEFADPAVLATGLRYKDEEDYEVIWNSIRGEIIRGVGAHEIGHSIGLRHNFQGSYDAINFFDEYWEMRPENIRGSLEFNLAQLYDRNALTEAQAEGNMRGYQYSSIMDYHARFNGDWAGIGKYDEAAVLFAYTFGTYEDYDESHDGELLQRPGYVEIFDPEVITDQGAALIHEYDGRLSPANRSMLENHHYTNVYRRLGGRETLKARQLMRWDELEPQIRDRAEGRPVEVPYMFCSDEIAGALVSCNRWDLGADPLEIVQSAREGYFTYYPLNNFRRGRTYFDPIGPLNRTYRTMLTFLTVYQQWLLGNQDVDDEFLNIYYILAAGAGFNTLYETMTMPRYGSYRMDNDSNQLAWSSYDMGGDVEVKMGEGRRFRSLYDGDSGYLYYARMVESGHFWEWLGALFVAIEPVARTVAVDTAADREAFLVPFYLVFEEELTELFNGQITDEYYSHAPRIDMTSGRIIRPPAFELDAGILIDPMTGADTSDFQIGERVEVVGNLTQELYASLYGVAFFNELYTNHYVDQARVFKVGNGEQIAPGDGYELDSFTDPTTGLAYGVIRPIGGSAKPLLGEQIVNQGKDLVQQWQNNPGNRANLEFEIASVVDTINMLSATVNFYGWAE